MRVSQLWRFPVKSMGGEPLDTADVGEHGIGGDRAFGIVDRVTGMVLTGRREPRLLFASATWRDGEVVITLPDGSVADRDADLSAWLDRPVSLRAAGDVGGVYENPLDFEAESDWVAWQGPAGAWHDSARTRVSLVSESTLGQWDARRFRANVVLAGGDEDEDNLVGHDVELGGAHLHIGKRVSRCVMVTRPQPGLERDLSVLREINRSRDACLAVGAVVRHGGRVAVGDSLHDLGPVDAAQAG